MQVRNGRNWVGDNGRMKASVCEAEEGGDAGDTVTGIWQTVCAECAEESCGDGRGCFCRATAGTHENMLFCMALCRIEWRACNGGIKGQMCVLEHNKSLRMTE